MLSAIHLSADIGLDVCFYARSRSRSHRRGKVRNCEIAEPGTGGRQQTFFREFRKRFEEADMQPNASSSAADRGDQNSGAPGRPVRSAPLEPGGARAGACHRGLPLGALQVARREWNRLAGELAPLKTVDEPRSCGLAATAGRTRSGPKHPRPRPQVSTLKRSMTKLFCAHTRMRTARQAMGVGDSKLWRP
jgi:hypothetical protein